MMRRAARVLWAAGDRFFQNNGPDRAAAVAFYALLSLLPLLIFLISVGVAILGSFEDAYNGTLYLVRGVVLDLDDAAREELRGFVERAVRLQWPGILLLAWTARRTFVSLFGALDTCFEVPPRNFFKGLARSNLMGLGMVLASGLGLFGTLALTTLTAAVEGLVRRLPVGGEIAQLAFRGVTGLVIDHALPLLVTTVFLFLVYRVVPPKVTHRQAAVGALVATLLWGLAKAGFAWYVRNLAQYAGIYGALEGLIVLALWLALSISVILFGAEVVEQLIRHGQAAGAPEPAGAAVGLCGSGG